MDGWNCVMHAVSTKISVDSLAFLFESCARHGIDLKRMLEQKPGYEWNCVILAVRHRLFADSFKLLIETCIQNGVDMKEMLERKSSMGRNCIMLAVTAQCPPKSLARLIESCIEHGVDIMKMLEQKDKDDWNGFFLAVFWRLAHDSLKVLIAHLPSNESFCAIRAVENSDGKRAAEYAETVEIGIFIEDPDCRMKCREWCASNGITVRRSEQESGKRRERE